jgi:23S rRNA (uracil1939-C5)-methyltransferase
MEVTIERILPGGLGLAHAEGKTVMVALAAAGDRVRVHIDREKGNVSFASIEEIIEASPDRVEPPCPYFGRCGGCDFQQMNYQAQLDAKVEIVRDCLRRLARIENPLDIQIVPAHDPWHYRSRAQWQYDAVRQRLGYFESGSRNVCDVAVCAVLAPPLQDTLESLRARMQEGSLSENARDFRAVVGDEGVSTSPGAGGPIIREGADSSSQRKEVHDITRVIAGESYRLNAESFFQATEGLLPQLIDTAIADANGETALDLYCGVGLFTLPLARRFKRVIGIESDAAAVGFARANLARAGLANAEIDNQNVGRWLEDLRRNTLSRPSEGLGSAIEFVLLDPPRTGAESRVITEILDLRPRRISYVSCDPATLARDLRKLIAGGYAIQTVAAFDMFPQTHHIETVVRLAVA